jgi:hypothetical protein
MVSIAPQFHLDANETRMLRISTEREEGGLKEGGGLGVLAQEIGD